MATFRVLNARQHCTHPERLPAITERLNDLLSIIVQDLHPDPEPARIVQGDRPDVEHMLSLAPDADSVMVEVCAPPLACLRPGRLQSLGVARIDLEAEWRACIRELRLTVDDGAVNRALAAPS